VRRPLLLAATCAVLALALAGPALADFNGGIAPPDSATDAGSTINEIYWIVIGITAAVFLLVEGTLVWFLFRFRRRKDSAADADGPEIHGHTRLELAWTAVPFLILVAIMVVTIVKVPSVEARPEPGVDVLDVEVEAHQFYWEYAYENGVVSVDHLVLPVDRPIRLVLRAYDVIHSWWVPELTGKRDAIPGRTNELTFTATRTGTFRGQCAELCGVQHAVMHTTVDVVEGARFDAWIAAETAAQEARESELGRQTWEGVCAKCHALDGSGGYGPLIAGNSTLVDVQALGQLLAEGRDNPQIDGYMPAVSTGWPDHQLEALIDFIESSPELAPAAAAQGG
jgi:cytochrome c oxidase subunit 2